MRPPDADIDPEQLLAEYPSFAELQKLRQRVQQWMRDSDAVSYQRRRNRLIMFAIVIIVALMLVVFLGVAAKRRQFSELVMKSFIIKLPFDFYDVNHLLRKQAENLIAYYYDYATLGILVPGSALFKVMFDRNEFIAGYIPVAERAFCKASHCIYASKPTTDSGKPAYVSDTTFNRIALPQDFKFVTATECTKLDHPDCYLLLNNRSYFAIIQIAMKRSSVIFRKVFHFEEFSNQCLIKMMTMSIHNPWRPPMAIIILYELGFLHMCSFDLESSAVPKSEEDMVKCRKMVKASSDIEVDMIEEVKYNDRYVFITKEPKTLGTRVEIYSMENSTAPRFRHGFKSDAIAKSIVITRKDNTTFRICSLYRSNIVCQEPVEWKP